MKKISIILNILLIILLVVILNTKYSITIDGTTYEQKIIDYLLRND